METPNLSAIAALRAAWNKGRIVGQKTAAQAQTRLGKKGAAGACREPL